jgi:predicted Zn-dependent protease
VASFRRMSVAEARAARPLRLKSVTVTARDNIDRLAQRMAYHDKQIERFRVINGLDQNDKLKPGDVVKIVVE